MTSTAQLVMDQQQQGEEYDNAYSDFGGTAKVVVTIVVCQQCTPLHTYTWVPLSY